jgi:hypothetical protein
MVRKKEVEEVTHTVQSLLKELVELNAAKEKTIREYMQVLAENIAKDDEIERLKEVIERTSRIGTVLSEQEAGKRMRIEGRKIPSKDQAYGLPRDPLRQKSIDGMKKRGEAMKK